VVETQPYFKAEISKLKDSKPKNKEEYEALLENVKDLALKIIELDPTFRMLRILP
jgi:ATP-dependent Lon protease